MKQLFIFLLAATVIASCNNDKAPGTGTAAAGTTEETKSAEAATGCSVLIWFKKGTVMQYEMKGQNNYQVNTTTTITDVRSESNGLVAEYTSELGNGKKVSSSYRCEGSKLFVDMRTMFNDMMSTTQKNGLEFEVAESYLVFPWDMKEGDQLEQSQFELKANRDGKEFMKIKRVINDRHVDALEKVTTAAGTFDCLKITEKGSTSTTMMGQEMAKTNDKTIQWFSPKAGLVKTESYDKDGKLQLTTELVSLK